MTTPLGTRGSALFALGVTGAALLLVAPAAEAFLGVGDTGDVLLADLLANGMKQLGTLTDSLATLRKNYDEARKVTGYAADGYALAAGFQHFSLARFGERLRSDVDGAYPDAAVYRDGMESGRWVEGGRLAPYLRYCLSGTLSKDATGQLVFDRQKLCTQLREEVGTSQTLASLGTAFGTVTAAERASALGREASVVDAEVAAQLAAQTSQWNRTARVKEEVEQLLADCAHTSDGKGPSAACEAAAQRAQMDGLAEQAETNRLLSEQARLLALQLAQGNADLKRELAGAADRRAALAQDGEVLRSEQVRIRAGAPGS